MKLYDEHTNDEIVAELGRRLQQLRIASELTQAELAARAGVTRSTVQRIERGDSVQLDSLVRLLRPLRRIDALDVLLPEATRSPIAEVEGRGPGRKRVRASTADSTAGDVWTWGEE